MPLGSGFGIAQFKVKELFFDRRKVEREIDGQKKRYYAKAGAYVMTTAKRSIRSAKGPASPGSPPHSHDGSLKRLIYFSYEPTTQSVVIGPTLFRLGTAPEALEYGGTSKVIRYKGGRKSRGGRKVVQTMAIKARPYMLPALERAVPALPTLWANSIK